MQRRLDSKVNSLAHCYRKGHGVAWLQRYGSHRIPYALFRGGGRSVRTASLELSLSPGAAGVPDSKAPALQLLAFYPRHLAQTLAHE